MAPLTKMCFCLAAMHVVAVLADDNACASGSPVASAQEYLQGFDKFSLTYFDGRGLAEVARTLFAMVGRFPGKGFEDIRLNREQFAAKKEAGELVQNLNRMPILNHNGVLIGQSSAINHHLAQQFGLLGTNSAEAAQIGAMVGHINDVKSAYRNLVPYGTEMTTEQSGVWFNTPSSPALEKRKERQFRWFLEKIEKILPDTGYSVGARPSLADAYIFNAFGEHAPELGGKGEPFANLEQTNNVLAGFPKMQKVVQNFKQSPGVAHYLKTRVKVGF